MEEFLKIDHKKKILYFVLMMLFTIFMVITILTVTSVGSIDSHDVELDDGWEVNVGGKTYSNVTLSTFRFDMCNRGDVVTLKHILPRYDTVEHPTLNMYSVHSAVKVSLDEEVIYQYGQRLFSKGKMLGYGRHLVPIPQKAMSKWLTIEFKVSEDNAFDGVQPMTISDGNTIIIRDISGKRINLAIALFLVMFGVITMVLSMFMLKRSVNFVHTFCIAMFSFLMGCWTLCNSDLIEYMSSDLLIKAYVEYISLYLIPLPFTYYFRDRIDEKGTPKWIKAYFRLLIVFEAAFIITACVLQFTNVVHLPRMLTCSHILMLLAIVFFVVISVRDIKQHKKISSVMIGFIIAIVIVLAELLRFNLNKYFTGFSKNEYNSGTCIAVLIIVIAMLVDYANKISRKLYENAQQMLLEQMAYMDELTGLANRRACEKKLHELSEADPKEIRNYAIMSFDLNFLKKANDTYGHKKGDELIKAFADVLREIYGLYGIVARTGGDEFVVIMDNVSSKQVDKLIDQMHSYMDEKNHKMSDIKLSTAYGYALSDETFTESELKGELPDEAHRIDPHTIYRIADDRMYAYKKKSKLGR